MQPTLTAPVRENLLAMQNTARMLSQTQTRLATGKKVNSALDNPVAFFQAKGLDDRAQALAQLLDSMSMAQSTVEAADNALDAISELVGQARGLASQALQAEPSQSKLIASDSFSPGATTSITLSLDGVETTVNVAASDTAADFAANIGAQVAGVTAKVGVYDDIVIETTRGGRLELVASSDVDNGFYGTETATVTSSATRAALAAQFNEIRTQIDEIARDAGFNGVNLLRGDSLTVAFNEKASSSGQRSSLTLEGRVVDTVSLGISRIEGFDATSRPGGDFQLDGAIDAALDELTGALDQIASIASSYASDMAVLQIREDFTRDMVDTLQAGSDKLTLADPNEEGARMLALQTRQELASTALSIAAQAQQSVLRLF